MWVWWAGVCAMYERASQITQREVSGEQGQLGMDGRLVRYSTSLLPGQKLEAQWSKQWMWADNEQRVARTLQSR